MELADVKSAMRMRVPVAYDGVRYEYIRACIMRLSEKGEFTYSLELLDRSLSAVVVAQIGEVVLLMEDTNGCFRENQEQKIFL